jgi:hypothetical protein
MATILIQNGFSSGAMQAICAGRWLTDDALADYADEANVVRAISDECIVKNALLTVPMADADNTEIGYLCYAAAAGVLAGRSPSSITAADYAAIADAIVNVTKATVGKLV